MEQDDSGGKGIQVICAGLGRTGTLSLTDALSILGYKPYHYVDFKHIEDWAEFVDGRRTVDEIIDRIVDDGYTATLENPTCDIFKDLIRRYPKATVILTVRDTPESFVKSWKLLFDTMIITEMTFTWTFPSFLGYIPLFRNLKRIRHFMGTTHLGLSPGDFTHGWRDRIDCDEFLAEQYEKHNQYIIDSVPKDQLLVFNVKQGWEPLCRFLNKEIPDSTPFPHSKVNNAESLKKMRRMFCGVVYGWIPLLVTTVLGVGLAALHMRGTQQGGGRSPWIATTRRREL